MTMELKSIFFNPLHFTDHCYCAQRVALSWANASFRDGHQQGVKLLLLHFAFVAPSQSGIMSLVLVPISPLLSLSVSLGG